MTAADNRLFLEADLRRAGTGSPRGRSGTTRQLEQRVRALREAGRKTRFRGHSRALHEFFDLRRGGRTAQPFKRARRPPAKGGLRVAGFRAIQRVSGNRDRGAGHRSGRPDPIRSAAGPGAIRGGRAAAAGAWISGARSTTRPSMPTGRRRHLGNRKGRSREIISRRCRIAAPDRELLCENQGVPGDCDALRQDGGRLPRP